MCSCYAAEKNIRRLIWMLIKSQLCPVDEWNLLQRLKCSLGTVLEHAFRFGQSAIKYAGDWLIGFSELDCLFLSNVIHKIGYHSIGLRYILELKMSSVGGCFFFILK